MPKRTIKEAISSVLRKSGEPLSIKEIYNKIIELDYYRFRAERPEGIVGTEVRRHCKGLEFPTANPKKYYEITTTGKFWLLGRPLQESTNEGLLRPSFQKISSETIRKHHEEYADDFRSQIITQLKAIDPQAFESFSRKLLEVYGFKEMNITPFSKDGGIDGYGKLKVGITYLNVAFQSKRWKGTVPKKEIQSFRGDIQGSYEQGIYFTTSAFTRDAKAVSIQKGAVPIILIDGNTIVDIMMEKKFGIEIESLPIYINALDKIFIED